MRNRATLRWKNQATRADGIRLYKSTSPIDESSLPPVYKTLSPDTEEYIDTDNENNLTYYYMLGTFRGSNEVFSREVSVEYSALELGPGPQELIGYNDAYAGFFGEVPSSEFITGSALASEVGLPSGTNVDDIDSIPWLKFALDNKILFVAKRNLKHTISWDHLNDRNLVTGDTVINFKGYRFKVRLLKGIRPDPEGIEWSRGYDPEITHGSEWNRLIYNICEPVQDPQYPRDSQIGSAWVEYPLKDIDGYGGSTGNASVYLSWCQERWSSGSNRVRRGNRSLSRLNYDGSSATSPSVGWRPCLELITD